MRRKVYESYLRVPFTEVKLAGGNAPEMVDAGLDDRSGDTGLLAAVGELSLERRVVVLLRYGLA